MKTALITGCSSGFGRAMADRFLESGWTVMACLRKAEARAGLFAEAKARHGDRLLLRELDHLEPAHRGAVREAVDRDFGGRLDCLVLNAGGALFGSLEDAEEEQLRRHLEVNYTAPMLIARDLLPALRSARGRIILLSSVMGFLGLSLTAPYVAAKFALEGLGESLRHELAPKGVQVCLVQPGRFRTRLGENVEWSAGAGRAESAYAAETRSMRGTLEARLTEPGRSPEAVAAAVLKLAESTRMPLRARVGGDAAFLAAARRLLPSSLFLGLMKTMTAKARKGA